MSIRHVLVSALVLFPIFAFPGISGKYVFKGVDRNGDSYKGKATIVKGKKGVYNVRWVYSDGSFDVGTGVVKGDHISFVFTSVVDSSYGPYGVISYKIDDHIFKGKYAFFAEKGVGREKMKKVGKH